jgi:ribose transport system substrate-binding protein
MQRLLLWLAVILPCACSHPDSGAAPKTAKTLRIAVIPKGTSHEFWKAVEAGARRADAELADLEIVWKGPAGESGTAQQIALVESFLADGYDGICLAPLDARALETPVEAAFARHVPVVLFDSGLASSTARVASFVATDNRRGGEMAGEELARALGGKGNVLVLRYVIGSESTTAREDGCLAALSKFPGIHVISSDKHGGPDEARAIEVSENLLSTLGDKLDGVFCSNESNASGFLTALARDPRGLAGKIQVVGFDSSANIVRALESGALHATVLQNPVEMGYRAVMTMHDQLLGKQVPARIDTGETLATKENLQSAPVRALLSPLASPLGPK